MEARKIGFDDTFLTEGRTGLNNYGFKWKVMDLSDLDLEGPHYCYN
jgi:hypothetical protein